MLSWNNLIESLSLINIYDGFWSRNVEIWYVNHSAVYNRFPRLLSILYIWEMSCLEKRLGSYIRPDYNIYSENDKLSLDR